MKNISKKWQCQILWGIFIFTIVIVVTGIIGIISGFLSLDENLPIYFITLSLPVVLLVLHAVWTLTYFRGFAFILIALSAGFVFEIVGMKYVSVFGGPYIYQFGSKLTLFDVPLLIPLYWAVFIYTGYNIVSSFLFWTDKEKPNKHRGDAILLPLLVLLDGLVIVAIDLFMDPLQVKVGNWVWLEGGQYYDVPLGNFMGWFIVAMIATGVFRVFEYFSPQEHTDVDKSVFIMPIIGYGVVCIAFFSIALKIQLPELALTGLLAMFPVVIINLIFFINWRKSRRK